MLYEVITRELLDPQGEPIPLTASEFDLLQVFAERPNRTLSRDQLLSLTQNRDWDPFDRSIDIRIARLRKKIEARITSYNVCYTKLLRANSATWSTLPPSPELSCRPPLPKM